MGFDASRMEELRAEAHHHRARLDLYRAKSYGPRETSAQRLRDLEKRSAAAEERLHAAERENAAAG